MIDAGGLSRNECKEKFSLRMPYYIFIIKWLVYQ